MLIAVPAAASCLLASAGLAPADTIYLKKGGRLKGVIVSESEGSVEIKSKLGTITLSRGAIARIEKAPENENKALEKRWVREKEEREEKAMRERRFEEEQRAKGLVLYRGAWVPAEKVIEAEKGSKKKLETESQELEEQRRELDNLEKRLREMEARLERKESELNFREQQLSIREQNLLLQQQNLQRQAEQIAREKEERPPKIFAIPRIEVVPPSSK